jgi:hypothetical protein
VNRKYLMPLWWLMLASLPALGQEKVYPVRGNKDVPVILTSDRSGIVVEKAFQHKLTLGSPDEDRVSFVPETRAPIIMLWLRIQNVSPRTMKFDASKFTSTDAQGKMYPALVGDDAVNRILAGASDGSLGTKTLRGISLGRVGSKPTDEQLREDIQRYSLQSGEIAPGAVKEGLIYFERPSQKKFTVKITLGDLWSQPLTFSTEKQK